MRYRPKIKAPLCDYIIVGFVRRIWNPSIYNADGELHPVDSITLEYCEHQVKIGNWEVLNG